MISDELKYKDLGVLFILLGAFIIIGVIVFSNFMTFANIKDVNTDLLIRDQMTKTEHATGQIENHLIQLRWELVERSRLSGDGGLSREECDNGEKSSSDTNIFRTDDEGIVVGCSSSYPDDILSDDISNSDFFKDTKDNLRPYMTRIPYTSDAQSTIISVPLFNSTNDTPYPDFTSDFDGVLFSIVELDDLYNLYIDSNVPGNETEFLLSDKDSGIKLLGDSDTYSVLDSSDMETGAGQIINISGIGESIFTSSDIELGNNRLRLTLITPLASASADMLSLQQRHLFSLIFIGVVGVGMTIYLLKLYKSREEFHNKFKKAKNTLDKFGIKIDVEEHRYSDADISLEPGDVYLIKEDKENTSHELFVGTLNKGYPGLGIIRDDPSLLKKRYNLQKTSFVWMSKTYSETIPTATDISTVRKIIDEFIKKSDKSVVLIDRLDYLITENSFEETLKMIHNLKDRTMKGDSIIIVSIDPETLSSKQLHSLEADTNDIFGNRGKSLLNDIEHGILSFINERNVNNQLVTFKDITKEFSITKPTTKAKISKLNSRGLLKIEDLGRSKSILITSLGRRLIR